MSKPYDATIKDLAAVGPADPLTEILHLDAQADPSSTKQLDVLAYNALLHRKYGMPVHSCVLLLQSQAEHPNMTGRVQYAARPERGKMEFGFEVIRLWEIPAERCFAVRCRPRRWPFWASCPRRLV